MRLRLVVAAALLPAVSPLVVRGQPFEPVPNYPYIDVDHTNVVAAVVMAQAPDPGDLMYKYVDHTNTPIYTVDDINMSWAPISLGRNETTVIPPLPANFGPVYSNRVNPFSS
ncbi:MAG: hypothetical protein V3W34_06870 [Phycisphaerae bacterium]